jgi:hypothetical protein
MRTAVIIVIICIAIGLSSIFWNVYHRTQEPELADWQKAIIEEDIAFAFDVKEWIRIQTAEYNISGLERDPVLQELIDKYIALLNRTRD